MPIRHGPWTILAQHSRFRGPFLELVEDDVRALVAAGTITHAATVVLLLRVAAEVQ